MGWGTLVARIAALAVANHACGRLALLMATPPGYVSSVWPPAGLSLAAILLWGPCVWPGIFLGALATQLPALTAMHPDADGWRLTAVAAAIAAGSTAQALGAAWALRRLSVKTTRLDEGHDVFLFVLVGCLAGGLIAPAAGTAALSLGGLLQAGLGARVWTTWWVGEVLGTALAGPLVLGLARAASPEWRGRVLPVFGTLAATCTLALAVFGLASSAEQEAVAARFQAQASSLTRRLEGVWRGHEALVSSTASLFEAAGEVDRSHFKLFASRLLAENLGIVALQWAPCVESARRSQVESEARRDGLPGFQFRELTPDGRLVPALVRDSYTPVLYLEPSAGFEQVLGFDASSETSRRLTLERAARSGRVVATPPLRPVRSPEGQETLALVRAVSDGTPGGPAGFVLGIFRPTRMVGAALAAESWHGFRMSVVDADADNVVVYREARDLEQLTPEAAEAEGLSFETLQTLGGRRWQVRLTATREFVRDEYSWQPYGILTVGLAFCSMAAAFLLILTGRTSKIEQLVLERTDELRASNAELQREVGVRQQIEAELRVARDAALEASRCKSDFLANMSHEIRTPANAIIGLADLLSQSPGDHESPRLAGLIRTAGGNLLQLINDLLDYSKLEAGKHEPQPAPFALRASLRNIVSLMAPRATDRGVELVLEDGGLAEELVLGDEGMIRQVLLNLVSNAVKFTDRGKVLVRALPVPDARPLGRVRFEVIDQGCGIAEEAQPRLFEKFYQAPTPLGSRQPGTGLGLAISKQLVQLMGGTIGMTSQPGRGSTFFFELPLPAHLPEPGATGAGSNAAESPAPGDPAIPLQLLVVDDNPTNQFVLAAMLERLGHRVEVASDGREALESLRRHRYDAVLMDCNMPVMDGYAATRAIRDRQATGPGATPPEVRVIGVTAYALRGDREKCLAAGMDDYLSKPVTLERLRLCLRRAAGADGEPGPASGPAEPPLPRVVAPREDSGGVSYSLQPTAYSLRADEALATDWPLVEAQLESLVAATDRATVRRIVELFLADLQPRLTRLEMALENGEPSKLATVAHALAGSCCTVGARGSSRACLALEESARSNRREEAGSQFGLIREELGRLRALLTGLLESRAWREVGATVKMN
jgi:signal transduction histidine kinase/DNA-binding response OmpR family regulator